VVQYRDSICAFPPYYLNWELAPIPALDSPSYHRNMPMTIFLAILGFSLLVAGLDFMKRRADRRVRAVTMTAQAIPPQEEPSLPNVVSPHVNQIAESRTVALPGGLARPHTDCLMPSLPFAKFLPLPKPDARLPQRPDWIDGSVSWWQA
jgi:hypothetical protein